MSNLKEEVSVKLSERKLKGEEVERRYKLSELGIKNSKYENRVIIENGNLLVTRIDEKDMIEKAAESLNILTKVATTKLENTTGSNLINYRIYGNSVQNGTPTPDNPIEVQSLGDLVTNESDVNFGKYKISIAVSDDINLFNNRLEYGSIISNNGVYFDSDRMIRSSDFIPVESNSCYILSEKNEIINKVVTVYYDSDYKFISSSQNGMYIYTPENCAYIKFRTYDVDYNIVNLNLEFKLVKCIINNIYLNEPLRKVGNYADYVDFKSQKLVRNIGMKTTNFKLYNYNTETKYLYLTNSTSFRDKLVDSFQCLSNKIYLFTSFPGSKNENKLMVSSNSFYYFVGAEESNIQNYIDLMKDTAIYYLLAIPTEETIELPTIQTLKGTTCIAVTDSKNIEASKIEVEY